MPWYLVRSRGNRYRVLFIAGLLIAKSRPKPSGGGLGLLD